MGVGTLHVQMEHRLTNKLRLRSVPSFVAIVNGKPHYYTRSQFGVTLVRDFLREILPRDIITMVCVLGYILLRYLLIYLLV